MICRNYYVSMIGVMSFSSDKHEKFYRCHRYHDETKHKKLRDDDLTFGEVLSRELHKRK